MSSIKKKIQSCYKALGNTGFYYYDIKELGECAFKRLPFSIRVLLESAGRNCDDFQVTPMDVENILSWEETSKKVTEIPFKPSRVILQDFTGVPAVVDFAAMRDAMARVGGNPAKINPLVRADLVIDHSVMVDFSRSSSALERNLQLEFQRNSERFSFLKWGAKAFKNMLIVPPGSGIVHQVNLEYLADVVMNANVNRSSSNEDVVLFPDSVVGTDSHTTMINGLGVLGWGVGGIEAEAVMLGQSISMVLPEVVGFRLEGNLRAGTSATDLVLTCVNILKKRGVVGKFVEFHGEGCRNLSLEDRATIANMAPEFGGTMGFFPIDENSLQYLRSTGRPESSVVMIEQYLRAVGMFQTYDQDIVYSGEVLHLDLSTVEPSVSGPKRPHDTVKLVDLPTDFRAGLSLPNTSFKGFGVSNASMERTARFSHKGHDYEIKHGSVVIAAITSCTNTSNPGVMIASALLARNANRRGLTVAPYIKTSLSPGSQVVDMYFKKSGLLVELEKLGFYTTGFGCMTCIGNSGDLDPSVSDAITENELVAAAVLSGNRNFEGRVHPLTVANYLGSPPLVVAFALAGRVDIDFSKEPLGYEEGSGKGIFLSDIWPSQDEVHEIIRKCVLPEMFVENYANVTTNNKMWNELSAPEGQLFEWPSKGDSKSTYIQNPPFFMETEMEPNPVPEIKGARCLLNLGDSITTDHISPAGKITRDSPAGKYLLSLGVEQKNFNSYGSRRGNYEVMARGTFANLRIINKLRGGKVGPLTVNHLTGETDVPIYDAAVAYREKGIPLIILAGAEYGSGSSRDWAAKGPSLLGVRAVVAVSYERIHRSNLVGMGILPLQFINGENADNLGLDGTEEYNIDVREVKVGGTLEVQVTIASDATQIRTFGTIVRLDTDVEHHYYLHGGILQYVLRQLAKGEK